MEVFEFINERINIREKKTKLFFLFLCVLYVMPFIIYYEDILSNWHLLIFDFLILIIIYLWIYYAPKFCHKFELLGCCFKDVSYESFYTEKKDFFYLKKRFNIYKASFIVIWILSIIAVISIAHRTHFYLYNIFGAYSLVIFILSMVLNGASYYFCISYVIYLRYLSNFAGTKKFKCNKYIPSSTYGFQFLISFSNNNAYVFLIVSLLYSICGYLILNLISTNVEIKQKLYAVVIGGITLLFGIGTFIAIFIVPYAFLKRILIMWKENLMKEIEMKIKNFNKDKVSDLESLININDILYKDDFKHGFDIVSIILLISTIIVNITGACDFIINNMS
ncbi:hypothetical protein BXY41_12150 [Lacrimispora xylanisolvens]|uniref:Uncharacterized protein n=1 Tax=Lacrimispora xylanisolvens TaxID=384636 RepID=A0A2S6HCB4_9FIRM|nr:hypothetical protein [Hungatella xylanolytica]MBE5988707.1 hypothetical protein [Paenibacillaceae bacterium]PPK75144.1 hypothetical protein BXY41_12150 [Hungatella xylanolytica]